MDNWSTGMMEYWNIGELGTQKLFTNDLITNPSRCSSGQPVPSIGSNSYAADKFLCQFRFLESFD
jgi:hypothetical protein